tara:strand:+ start:6811 stop:9525 length:2715 start_codon:yes stop_codon:yes gene_type:complete
MNSPSAKAQSTKNKSNKVTTNTMPQISHRIPVIGIGASAGGLEALEQFFANVPPDTGMAFVIVQHLDPHHKGTMCELLQRITPIPVQQISDQTVVKANNIYIIAPGFDLSIVNDVLNLLKPTKPHGQGLPIDFFFKSLALDKNEDSIGVILSGMGSDGTLGLRAIKDQAGAAFIQSPSSAKFDSMPCSAINAGLADAVAPAEDLIKEIVSFLAQNSLLAININSNSALKDDDTDLNYLERILVILRSRTAHDFSLYKKATIYRRVERRMALHQLLKISDYLRYIRANPSEAELLFKELLIGVTSFFRDPEVWEQLKKDAIPNLLSKHPAGGTIRAWVTACSTGEEAYSLAIIFREALEKSGQLNLYSLQIYATDLDHEAIDKARTGIFSSSISQEVSEARLKRFFIQENGHYRICKEIREMVIFAPQNLVMDPPFTKLDILTCRNLLIYLETSLQKKLLPLFHYSLNPDGLLVLGTSETVGNAHELFRKVHGKTRIYKRIDNVKISEQVLFPAVNAAKHSHNTQIGRPMLQQSKEPNLQELTNSFLLQHFAPSAVLSTNNGDILYINGKTGNYLEPAAGKVNNNLFAMARDGLSAPLAEGFSRALRETVKVELENIQVGTRLVNIFIKRIQEPISLKDMVIVAFIDVPVSTKALQASQALSTSNRVHKNSKQNSQLELLSLELARSREELQRSREEMQTSQEELKSTNEELQSTNEELQSTNEELTTSKEEMQSMNEELQTVNHELSAKVDELSKASDDMNNLLNSTDIATLFLDNDLCVRRFTDQVTSIIKLIPSDVGRPITDLVSVLNYPALVNNIQNVLRTLVFCEEQVSSTDGRWFVVRIMPYRTQDNRINGVVIIFSDITGRKDMEEKALQKALSALRARFNLKDEELHQTKIDLKDNK